jgi:hypothetical protein
LLQSTPTTQEHEQCDNRKPTRASPGGEDEDHCDADEADYRSYQQTTRRPEYKPKQGPQYLTAIQGINGQDIERKKKRINVEEGAEQYGGV